MLSPEVIEYVERSVLCWLATCDELGQPNVSPKEMFAPLGPDALVIANIHSPGSIRNIRANPRVCVSFVDVFHQRGFKVLGEATEVRKSDPRYEEAAAPLLTMTKGIFPIHSVVLVAADHVEPIIAPSYRLFDHTTIESQTAAAMDAYGVRPL